MPPNLWLVGNFLVFLLTVDAGEWAVEEKTAQVKTRECEPPVPAQWHQR